MYQYKRNKNNQFRFYIVSFLHCILVLSCAQVSAPSGGKRDTTPPVVVSSTPANYSTNFYQKEIKIEFDEWILPFVNPQAQVIISPNIELFPRIELARNELSIKFRDSLQPNTTYSIFFGDNIKDNNEGNILPNFKYILSTGPFIDSLQIKGKVETLLDKIPDNTYLLLYKEKEDLAFTQNRPFYITKIGADGTFMLENVKEDDYRIYALSDKNSNYYYDLPNEAIGFTDSVFHLKSNLEALEIELFLAEDSMLRIYDFERSINGGLLHLIFNKEISIIKDDITVEVMENKELTPIVFPEREPGKMTVYFPKLTPAANGLTLILKNNNRLIDTLKVRTESGFYNNTVPFFNDTTLYKSLTVIESKPLKLISSYFSLDNIDTTKIQLTDTSTTKIPFSISRDEDLQTYNITAAWKAGMKYELILFDSTIADLVGNYNKTQKFSFFGTSVKKAGNLLITYELPKKNHQYIAFLKDNSGKVLDKQILRDSQTVKMDYGLWLAGNYSLEVVDDENQNGLWNSGSFTRKALPEKIYKEIKPIVIKENWDTEEIIKVDFSVKRKLPDIEKPVLPSTGAGNIQKDKFNNQSPIKGKDPRE